MSRLRFAVASVISLAATGCVQSGPLRVEAGAQRIVGQDAVQIDVRTHRDGQVRQMPQVTVPIGTTGKIRTGTSDADGAFTGWAAECAVEPDRVVVDWGRFERGTRLESGLSMVRIN